MSAATSPGTGLAYGLRRVCAAWGMARSSFYAMTSGQHAEQPPAKRRGPKPAISDQALLVAIEADLEASPWEGEGYRKVWARRVCRDIRVARKRVLRLMRENNLLSPQCCSRRIPMTVRSSLMPRTSCGAPMAFGCSRWTTAGAGSSPPSSIGTPSVPSAATASPPCSRSPWGGLIDRGRRGSGAGLADGSRLPVSVGPLHQPDQVLSPASSRPIYRRRAPDQRRASQSPLKEQIIHGPSTATSRAAGRRPRLRNSTMPSGSLPEPRSSSSGVSRISIRRRVRRVQGTGQTRATKLWVSAALWLQINRVCLLTSRPCGRSCSTE